jgi:hypothetical protein
VQERRREILARDNSTISLKLRNFHCNWVVVNVIINADSSIDGISLNNRVFTVSNKVTFHGAGNAAGSGHYKAVIVPRG